MKLSMYEAFDLVAEEAVELLAEYDRTAEAVQEYSAETTIRAVLGDGKSFPGHNSNISDGEFSDLSRLGMGKKTVKKRSRKMTWKVRLLAAAIIVTAFCSASFARFRGNMRRIDGAELVDETNRDLVGKVETGIASVYDADGKLLNGDELYEAYGDPDPDLFNWRISSVIQQVADGVYIPATIDEFPVREADGEYRTPEVIFRNGAMVIFTKEDGSGWDLKKGGTLRFEVEEYPSEIGFGKGQNVSFVYIFNGLMMDGEAYENRDELEVSFALTAEKAGEYYVGVMGVSSDPITFREGKIQVSTQEK